ncbi:MAG: transglycosylase domain-containing protein [Polyangiaceae bacterium]|nr:transglycosylase domain-containing protein [Polyangiaceae bacterium]
MAETGKNPSELSRRASTPPLDGAVAETSPARDAGSSPRAPRRPLRVWCWRTFQILVLLGILAGIAGAITVVLVIRHYEGRVPSVEQLRKGYAPPQVTRVLARDGTVLANLFTERRTVVPLTVVPAHAKLAFLAAEDARFYEHRGLNYFGMLRALWANLRAGKTRQGGSTITQQVVKNILLDDERTYERKIKETILARRLEQNLSKDEIFSLYLNHIYFGHGRYGVEEASRYYFGKHTADLDLAEASLLAGLVAAPERFSPRTAAKRSLERRRYVLGQMLEKGFIDGALHAKSVDAPLRLAPAAEEEADIAPEVVAQAKALLGELVGERARLGGFTITTTIDPGLQAAARRALRQNLDDYAKRQKLAPPFTLPHRRLWGSVFTGTPRPNHSYVGTVIDLDDKLSTIDVRVGDLVGRVSLNEESRFDAQRLPPSKFTEKGAALRVHVLPPVEGEDARRLRLALGPQSALVAIDVRSREVRALVGSYEAVPGGLDRATRAKRQPGSSFKPFLYSYALHSRRFAPSSVLELSAAPGRDPEAPPTRLINVRSAIATSDNAAAEHIIAEVGPANVVAWAHACGVVSELGADKALALGSYEVTPLEIANAFGTFASGGEYAPPRLVTRIVDPDGRELPLPPMPPARRVLTPEEAYLTTSLLRGVVEQGTARRAIALGRPVAGKTGTTNEAKDAWFVGYSTDYVAAIWVGYDSPLGLGAGEQGAATALPGWVEFMRVAHRGRPAVAFPRPPGIVVTRIDAATGLLPYDGQEDAVEEEFLPDGIPAERALPDAGVLDDAGVDLDAGAPDEVPSVSDSGEPRPTHAVAVPDDDAGASARPFEDDAPPPF